MRHQIAPALAVVLALGAAPALAQETDAPPRSIVVAGMGEATAEPDIAVIVIGVETEGSSAAEAMRKNSAQMQKTMDALRRGGVDEKDMQTSNLSLGPRYDYSEDGSPPRLVGYTATNTLSVKLREIDEAGALIDDAIGSGANRIDSISFQIDDPTEALNAARKEAVAEARATAELLAEAADVRLGRVMQISEAGYVPPPMPYPMARMEMAAADQSVPIAPGETTLSATVTITYGIE